MSNPDMRVAIKHYEEQISQLHNKQKRKRLQRKLMKVKRLTKYEDAKHR